MDFFNFRAAGTGIENARRSVYQQEWWLDIARAGMHYTELQVQKDGVVVGTLPCAVARTDRLYFRLGGRLPWSRICQPILADSLNNEQKREVLRELMEQLPRRVSFNYTVESGTKDAQLIREAFIEAGFEYTRTPTYSITAANGDIMDRLDSRHKSHIRRAERELEILGTNPDEPVSAADFVRFYQDNLNARDLRNYASLEIALALIEQGQKKETPQIRVFAARKKSASPNDPWEAAIACAWDDRRVYNWMMSRPPDGHQHAIKRLIVEAVRFAQKAGLRFDADGAPTEGHHRLYKEILRLPDKEFRDNYKRLTVPRRIFVNHERDIRECAEQFRRCVKQIKRCAAVMGLQSVIPQQQMVRQK